nr:hypothetical protein [Tanacetum cinerariifolium]
MCSIQSTCQSSLWHVFNSSLLTHHGNYPHINNGIYNVVDRVMRPLALKQVQKPQSDRGKACHSISSTSAHYNCGYSSHEGDDGASRASIPSPTTYLNSLKPLDYQQYDIPTSSEQDNDLLFEHYIPKSPTSFTSPSTNGYLNSPTSPPPRVPPPPLIQENRLMDITLTLSPTTLFDVQFYTPLPSPPIFGHPIPWNLLEAHGDLCLHSQPYSHLWIER